MQDIRQGQMAGQHLLQVALARLINLEGPELDHGQVVELADLLLELVDGRFPNAKLPAFDGVSNDIELFRELFLG